MYCVLFLRETNILTLNKVYIGKLIIFSWINHGGLMEKQVMVKNFNGNDYIDEKELLVIIHDFIEENVLINIINEFIDEDIHYLKTKDRELRWLAAKARFRAVKTK